MGSSARPSAAPSSGCTCGIHTVEGRAAAQLARDLDEAVVLGHHRVHERQAQARAAARGLGGEEGLEDAVDHLGRDAVAACRSRRCARTRPAGSRRCAPCARPRRSPGAPRSRACRPRPSPGPRWCTGSSAAGAGAWGRPSPRPRRPRRRSSPRSLAGEEPRIRSHTSCAMGATITGMRSALSARLYERICVTSDLARLPALMIVSR